MNRNDVVIIPPGIDVKKYLSVTKEPEENLFLMVGILEKIKHYDHAIMAFKIVTRYRPEAKLFIVGDGSLKQYLTQLIRSLSLEKNVLPLGSVDEKTKLDLLSKAQALIHLGRPEGFGIVLIEALATDTSIIAYDVPPLNELVKSGVSGVLVEIENIKDNIIELAKSIISINKYDFDFKALKHSVKKYDIEIVTKKFEDLYIRLIASK